MLRLPGILKNSKCLVRTHHHWLSLLLQQKKRKVPQHSLHIFHLNILGILWTSKSSEMHYVCVTIGRYMQSLSFVDGGLRMILFMPFHARKEDTWTSKTWETTMYLTVLEIWCSRMSVLTWKLSHHFYLWNQMSTALNQILKKVYDWIFLRVGCSQHLNAHILI